MGIGMGLSLGKDGLPRLLSGEATGVGSEPPFLVKGDVGSSRSLDALRLRLGEELGVCVEADSFNLPRSLFLQGSLQIIIALGVSVEENHADVGWRGLIERPSFVSAKGESIWLSCGRRCELGTRIVRMAQAVLASGIGVD